MKKFFYCLSLICVALSLVSGIATSTDEFRVLPYLQLYGEGRVQISYFSHSQINSNFELFDDQGTKVWSQEIQANEVPEIYYTSNEQNESISGIAQGSWLYGQAAYKHEAILPELQSGKTYKYTVSLGGSTFSSNFRSKPSQSDWEKIRFIALADSETEPKGRVTRRAWFPADLSFRPSTSASLWKDKFGVTTEQGIGILNYMLTEKQGYQENLKVINQREPDFIVMPGDLVQGSGYQPGWDEFFRQNAGEFGQGLTRYPIIPALGNWENFGALNGGYGFNEKGKFLPIVGRERYYAYFETPKVDDLQKHRQSYYRVDYGPITILTIDSSNGTPDQSRSNFSEEQKIKNQEFTTLGTDTQENYTQSEYNAQGGTDLSSFGPGSDQYAWLEKNLISAKESGQLIFAQFHHIPFSSGEHGVPINHELATGQGGVPMQVLHPLFEEYGVIAVFAGHDELFERSFVDKDNDGKGVMYYDVGVAGDGMRGEKRNWLRNPLQLLKYNPYSLWSADQSEKEQWNTSGANPILSDGGKHYGHLEVNLQRVTEGEQELAVIDFTPVYIFPVLDQNYNLQKVERREYNDKVQLKIPLRVIEEEPQLKEELSISLGEDGAFSTQIADYFKSGYSEDYDYEFSRPLIYTCEDLGLNEVQVKIKKDGIVKWDGVVRVTVIDDLPPKLEVKSFGTIIDIVSNKTFELKPEYFISSLSDNCGEDLDIKMVPDLIGCGDINSIVPIEVHIRVEDKSGNVTEATSLLTVDATESKKVSLDGPSTGVIGEEVKLELGSEFPYTVLGWYKGDDLISSSDSKILTVTSSGKYVAELLPVNGCPVFSQPKEIVFSEDPGPDGKPYPPVKEKLELALNEDGLAEIAVNDIFQETLPEDSGLTISFDKNLFNCEDIGENTIVVLIRDSQGNEWEETIVVKVEDNLPPILETKNIEVEMDVVIGRIELKPDMFISSISDNCGVKNLTIDKPVLECESLGKEITVELRAEDFSGNVTEKTAIVSVKSTVSQPVTIEGPESICIGEKSEIELTSEAGFEVVRWRRNGNEIAGQTGKTLEIEEGGVYHAVIRYEGGCLFETAKLEVASNELPEGEIGVEGNELTAPEGDQYQWFYNGEEMEQTTQSIEVHKMGEYKVEVTNEGGCSQLFGPVEMTISGILGSKTISKELKIYPNPVSSEVILEVVGDEEFENGSWKIYDSNGKDVSAVIRLNSESPTRIGLDASGIAAGTYLVLIKGKDQEVFLGRIVKIK